MIEAFLTHLYKWGPRYFTESDSISVTLLLAGWASEHSISETVWEGG